MYRTSDARRHRAPRIPKPNGERTRSASTSDLPPPVLARPVRYPALGAPVGSDAVLQVLQRMTPASTLEPWRDIVGFPVTNDSGSVAARDAGLRDPRLQLVEAERLDRAERAAAAQPAGRRRHRAPGEHRAGEVVGVVALQPHGHER